jgi:hypothetical protein
MGNVLMIDTTLLDPLRAQGVNISIIDTSEDDLRGAVLAENISIKLRDNGHSLDVKFDFLCPNCGKRHWVKEIDGPERLLSTVAWKLECGWVTVRMPWAETPDRQRKSIYGQEPFSLIG